jgi:hypothetical protein
MAAALVSAEERRLEAARREHMRMMPSERSGLAWS